MKKYSSLVVLHPDNGDAHVVRIHSNHAPLTNAEIWKAIRSKYHHFGDDQEDHYTVTNEATDIYLD